jgi:hypothetical protein
MEGKSLGVNIPVGRFAFQKQKGGKLFSLPPIDFDLN